MNDKAADARDDFENIIWPVLRRSMGGNMQSVESQNGALASDLDCDAGIDVYIKTQHGLETIASRVQWRHYQHQSAPWAKGKCPMSYTVRLDTELPKRLRALAEDTLNPRWTLQAYLDKPGGPLECIGWTLTTDLYRFILGEYEWGGFDPKKIKENSQDKRKFLVVDWSSVDGYRWFRHSPSKPRQLVAATQPSLPMTP